MKICKIKLLVISLITTLFFGCSSSIFHAGDHDFDSDQELTQEETDKIMEIGRASEYVFGTEEIPLLDGLEIIEEESTNFDTISGHIAISIYSTEINLKDIKKFYTTTLPQLGFAVVKDEKRKISYSRNDDQLEISFTNEEDKILVKFLIYS